MYWWIDRKFQTLNSFEKRIHPVWHASPSVLVRVSVRITMIRGEIRQFLGGFWHVKFFCPRSALHLLFES